MMIDIAQAIDAEAQPISIITTTADYWDANGNYVPGPEEQLESYGAVFAVPSRDLRDMPEGIRAEAKRVLWTRTPVNVNERVSAGGIMFKVLMVHDRAFEGGYYKAILGALQ